MSHSEEVRWWFERGASVAPDARKELLASHELDPEVRAEVVSLLSYDVENDEDAVAEFVSRVIGQLVDDDNRPAPVAAPSVRVGPFELGNLLGVGGMGVVYDARRVDGEVRQRVAVKFAHIPVGTSRGVRSAVYRRFARERQALASLRHPYIAGLIDAGATADGTPYAVIEQIDGVPIDQYCDESALALVDRLRLFLKLCDAVQFAHRNLIIHGDIKPDNVLVTPDGIPKLIDFGLASDLAEDGSKTQSRAFTPEYASPEQLLGSEPTVLTDVYALGAVLYRLSTGAKLRDASGASLSSLILSADANPVTRPSSLRAELKGDLENILLKALQADPQRRYGSVTELSDDLNRFLAGRPVRATPDSLLYRSRRFVRRHWLLLTWAAVLALALMITALVATIERGRAVRNAEETRRLANRLLFEIHDDIGGILGATRAREKLSAIAVEYLQAIEQKGAGDPTLTWDLFHAYARLACSRGGGSSGTGDTESAWRLADKALKLGEHLEATVIDQVRLDSLFDVYEDLAALFDAAGRSTQQRAAIDRLIALARRLQPLREAQALIVLARYLDDNGTELAAAEAYSRALSILRMHPADAEHASANEATLISALVGFGRAQALAGELSNAKTTLQEAIRRSERRSLAEPGSTQSIRQLYWSHIALGDVFGNPGRFNLERPAEAAVEYRKARAIAERLVQSDKDNDVAKVDLARTFSREAWALSETDPSRALLLLDQFRGISLQSQSNGPASDEARMLYLTASVMPLIRTGNYDRARVRMSEARRLFEEMKKIGLQPNRNALMRTEAMLLSAQGKYREAIARAQEQLAALPQRTNAVLGANHERIKLLERIQMWSAGTDNSACVSATEQLVRIWSDLALAHPDSMFIRQSATRALGVAKSGCSGQGHGQRAGAVPPYSPLCCKSLATRPVHPV